MMNQVKRVAMFLVLSVALVASAWGAGGDEGAQASADFGPPGTFPISGETQTLTALSIPMAGVEDMNTNWYSLYVEKMTNVKVEYVLAEGAEKVTVMLNSPTSYWGAPVSILMPSISTDDRVLSSH